MNSPDPNDETADLSGDELDDIIAAGASDQDDAEAEGTANDETVDLSGDELDETVTEVVPVQDDVGTGSSRKESRVKRGRWGILAAGLCLGGLGVSIVLWHGPEKQANDSPITYRQAISTIEPLRLEGFVVPLSNGQAFSYLSVSMVLKIQQGVSPEEIREKKHVLRGIIYDILRDETRKTGTLPSLERLKGLIVNGVNRVLSTGGVNDVYVNQYLAV